MCAAKLPNIFQNVGAHCQIYDITQLLATLVVTVL